MAAPLLAPIASAERQLSDPSFGLNKLLSLHRWVPWIAGFSADFVSDCFKRFLDAQHPQDTHILDPFAGVGTTLVEGYLDGRNVYGFEINPYAALATKVKLEAAEISERKLALHSSSFRNFFRQRCENGANRHIPRSQRPEGFSGRTEFFRPKVERKVLFALDYINSIEDRRVRDLFRLALGSVMVSFSNYSYEPSLTRRSAVGKQLIEDHDVCSTVLQKVSAMSEDIASLREQVTNLPQKPSATIHSDTIFSMEERFAERNFIDLIVTSPPYLNNYHYPRNTRPQMHWLGLTTDKGYAGARENDSFGKFWQTVRGSESVPLQFHLPLLKRTIAEIRRRNPDKGLYGGGGWANYVVTYFNDGFRLCKILRRVLKPGAVAIIVLGNSVIQGVEVRTDRFFGQVAELCGLAFEETVLLRKKRTGSSIIKSSVRVNSAAEKVSLYEAAIVLKNPR
jgi:DNA modification methylase